MDFSNEYNNVQNSVIRVISIINQGGINQQIVSAGSGVLIDNGKRVLTCSHCIVANTITVGVLSGQNNGQIGIVIFNDVNLDIAIIEFQQTLGPGVVLGNSNNTQIGQEAFVVGFPSHTTNITALGAHIAGFEPNNGIELIKIDASVNHGNSGGPLFNSAGELIGIVNSKFGNLSSFLNQIQQANTGGISMAIGGIDPVQVLQQLISEMKKNLNLGMGSAVPLRAIGNVTNIIGDLLV
jgi:S1-C subfamily serine protease